MRILILLLLINCAASRPIKENFELARDSVNESSATKEEKKKSIWLIDSLENTASEREKYISFLESKVSELEATIKSLQEDYADSQRDAGVKDALIMLVGIAVILTLLYLLLTGRFKIPFLS